MAIYRLKKCDTLDQIDSLPFVVYLTKMTLCETQKKKKLLVYLGKK